MLSTMNEYLIYCITLLDCPADPDFANGVLEGDRHYEGSANISCNPGYTTGGGVITCKDNGTWDTSTASPCNAVGMYPSKHTALKQH